MTDKPETVADVLSDERKCAEAADYHYTPADLKKAFDRIERAMAASAVNSRLYHAVNLMMAVVCSEGEIRNRTKETEEVMAALAEIDGGTYTPAVPVESPPASVPDTLRSLYAAAAKGFHVSESCGSDKKYHYVSKFDSLDDLLAYHTAWIAAMVSVRDAVPTAPEESP